MHEVYQSIRSHRGPVSRDFAGAQHAPNRAAALDGNATQIAMQNGSINCDGKTDTMMLRILPGHDESKTLDEIDASLKQTGCNRTFSPPGAEVSRLPECSGTATTAEMRQSGPLPCQAQLPTRRWQ